MKRSIYSLILFALLGSSVYAQTPFKKLTNDPNGHGNPFIPSSAIRKADSRDGNSGLKTIPWSMPEANKELIIDYRITNSGSYWIDLKPNQLWASRSSNANVIRSLVTTSTRSEDESWSVISEQTDQLGQTHTKLQQRYKNIPIHVQEVFVHHKTGSLQSMNGFIWTGLMDFDANQTISELQAIEAGIDFFQSKNINITLPKQGLLARPVDKVELIWYPEGRGLRLAYELQLHPNDLHHWQLIVDAGTGEVIASHSKTCALYPGHLYDAHACEEHPVVMDGATTTNDTDLSNTSRTVNAYQIGSNYYMIDVSRSGMFKADQSNLPNDPIGAIWTVDARNSSADQNSFEVYHCSNTNNNWTATEVSAHYNAGVAYEYFRTTFNRNSINGNGGTITSIINVRESGSDMDNAFWSGNTMYYGNGKDAFFPLAEALDVAGHEMSHGVIQNTANLEYMGQSGALNESIADIFGAMIDRDDWKIGEEVSKPAAFPSGTMRDMQNPNNGGNSLGDRGWQPKNMGEFVNLPNTPENDNGGVHINSGINNHAFYLMATEIGKNKAEQIIYRALGNYLTRSSQFVDMRNAAEKAVVDLYGNNSPEHDAVRGAYNAVGIGGGGGSDPVDDIETNNGQDFILTTDEQQSALYLVPPQNPAQLVELDIPAPLTRPSFTDDGSACVYVDHNNDMIVVYFDYSSGVSYEAFYLENDPQGIWRNVVVSKDGSRIAYTETQLANEINVFDFDGEQNRGFELYNPTTANGGIQTGDVLYADAMEFDYSGEYLIYDALNRIESNFGGGIEYWDIGFMDVFRPSGGNFGTGQIGKLFNGLGENESVGNPTLAKNSPYILAFDYIETVYDFFGNETYNYYVLGTNLETGDVGQIYQSTTIGYPSYSRLDNKMLFTYENEDGLLIATVDLNTNKITPKNGTDVILVTGAQKGVWFATGSREFTSSEDAPALAAIQLKPQPASDFIEISGNWNTQTEYVVMNLTGQVLATGNLPGNKQINISNLSPGLYALRLTDQANKVVTTRFTKQGS